MSYEEVRGGPRGIKGRILPAKKKSPESKGINQDDQRTEKTQEILSMAAANSRE